LRLPLLTPVLVSTRGRGRPAPPPP
jgi:hypothetical protein